MQNSILPKLFFFMIVKFFVMFATRYNWVNAQHGSVQMLIYQELLGGQRRAAVDTNELNLMDDIVMICTRPRHASQLSFVQIRKFLNGTRLNVKSNENFFKSFLSFNADMKTTLQLTIFALFVAAAYSQSVTQVFSDSSCANLIGIAYYPAVEARITLI
jgi:hypothetical protein